MMLFYYVEEEDRTRRYSIPEIAWLNKEQILELTDKEIEDMSITEEEYDYALIVKDRIATIKEKGLTLYYAS